jgi:hypothetical protein
VQVERELLDLELALEAAQGVVRAVECRVVEVVRHRDVGMERELRPRRPDGEAQLTGQHSGGHVAGEDPDVDDRRDRPEGPGALQPHPERRHGTGRLVEAPADLVEIADVDFERRKQRDVARHGPGELVTELGTHLAQQ